MVGASFVGSPATAYAVQVVKIGVSGPLTGGSAANGKDIENGVRMAINEANAQHLMFGNEPVQFVIDSVDDQGDPRIGVQVAQKLVDDGVAVVIGHFNSGVCLPASRVFAAAGIPLIDPAATNPEITLRGLKTVFRIIPTDAQNSGIAGKYAVAVTKAKRIAVMDDRTAFGQGEAEEFVKAVKAAGGKIVDNEYTNDKAVDFSAQLTNIKASNADLLFFGGLDDQAGLLEKRMKQLGLRAQFLGGGAVADTVFTKIAGSSAEGAMAWEYGRPLSQLPRGAEFADKYKKKFGIANLTYSPFAYDATWLAIDAMKKAASAKPDAFVPALQSANHAGITGDISFDAHGDLKNPSSTLYQVRNGNWQPVTTTSAN
ncbi:MAG: branched-chain amino acid ABC transporter substrate-binding protein [Paraburkholderia sp.]|nr:MAG: branched-chain amino acid ABC transporter substrate-binding protein [Paraburkholderia sp.]